MSSISALQAQLLPGTKAVITTHFNPDSDAIGSSLAWQNYLLQLGVDVRVIVPSAVSANLKWMAGAEDILNFEDTVHRVQIEAIIQEAAFVFCLDFSGMQRLHGLSHLIKAARGKK